ncbi:uncharacterized protein LOC134282769 [Saccostrea cucullata]|uniref:uncharacterized protein LOC134282769 n=1 Tax=Saccostrea cuccullata TaxID=36930 RepID=UPI002ED2E14F
MSPASKKKLFDLEETCKNFSQTLKNLKQKRSKKDNASRRPLHEAILAKNKFGANKALRNYFGLSQTLGKKLKGGENITDIERKKRKDALPERVHTNIQGFYQNSYISREIPNVSSVKKDLTVKMALEGSLKHTYDTYCAENPEVKVSYSKFVELRPKNVLTMSKTKYLQCLCEYCINIDFKLQSLRLFCSMNEQEKIADDRYALSRLTLCPKENNYYKKDCIDRNCNLCGVGKFDEAVSEMRNTFSASQITWKRWQLGTKTTEVNGRQTVKRFMELKRITGTVLEFLDQLRQELSPFSKHLFNAQWQSKEFENLKGNIPRNWVMVCLDFAENYCCRHQDEAQSAHWTYEQVTIHPVVAYYKCTEENCNENVRESVVFISEDHKHDYHLVQHFIAKTNEYLIQGVGLNIEKEIQFSDGAPTQYKSKYNFVDMSMCHEDFGFSVEKHFFGSRHGKGPCDGEAGVIKRSASLAVTTRGTIISNAEDFFNYSKNKLTIDGHSHSKRTFFFVKTGDVNRDREQITNRVKTVKQCRSLFSFRGIQQYIVTARERSCFCDACIGVTEDSECQFASLTGDWKVYNLKIRNQRQRNRDAQEDGQDEENGADNGGLDELGQIQGQDEENGAENGGLDELGQIQGQDEENGAENGGNESGQNEHDSRMMDEHSASVFRLKKSLRNFILTLWLKTKYQDFTFGQPELMKVGSLFAQLKRF